MRVYHQLRELTEVPESAVAIGNLDGCHLGHPQLLRSTLDYARAHGLAATVLTFYPHPVEVLNPTKKLARLTTSLEKLAFLEGFGFDAVLVAPFDEQLSSLSPEAFFERFLVQALRARSVHVGFNFCFGKARAGSVETLKELGRAKNIHVDIQSAFALAGEKVSSSKIRDLVREGDVVRAAQLLGRPYSISGLVSPGDHRGTTLGFPTANLRCPAEKVLPKNGVYVTRAHWQKQKYKSVTNVGVRPTFHADVKVPTVEVHLIDFSAKLYDEFVELDFFEKVRDEMRFDSVDELKLQIERDVRTARGYSYPENLGTPS